jgi:hypothetical protein
MQGPVDSFPLTAAPRRALVALPMLPVPGVSGGADRSRALVQGLVALGLTVDVVALASPLGPWAEPDAVAADLGARRVVVLPLLPGADEGESTLWPQGLRPFNSRAVAEALKVLTRREAYDLACIEFAEMARFRHGIVARQVVLTQHETGSLRAASEARARLLHGAPKVSGALVRDALGQWARWLAWEAALAREVAATPHLTIGTLTPREARHWKRLCGRPVGRENAVTLQPTGLCDDVLAASALPGGVARPYDLGFMGHMGHGPNVETLVALVNDVLPAIRNQRPGTTFAVGGHALPGDLRARLAADPLNHVIDTTQDPSAVPFFQSIDWLLSPIETGAGLRMKHLHALAAGTPVLTTLLGGAGLGEKLKGLGVVRVAPTVAMLPAMALSAFVLAPAEKAALQARAWAAARLFTAKAMAEAIVSG